MASESVEETTMVSDSLQCPAEIVTCADDEECLVCVDCVAQGNDSCSSNLETCDDAVVRPNCSAVQTADEGRKGIMSRTFRN